MLNVSLREIIAIISLYKRLDDASSLDDEEDRAEIMRDAVRDADALLGALKKGQNE